MSGSGLKDPGFEEKGSRRRGQASAEQAGARRWAILNGVLTVWTLATKGELFKVCEEVRDIMCDCER